MTRDAAGNLLTPPAGEDHAEHAMRACERGIDAMSEAEHKSSCEYWEEARAAFLEAAHECDQARAALMRAHNHAQAAQGLVQCARPGCGQWRKPEEMVAHTTEFGGKGEGRKRSSTMLTCKGRCSERP